MTRAILVALADMHAGHKLGLANPSAICWDEGPNEAGAMEHVARQPGLGVLQKMLWQWNMELVASTRDMAAGDPVYIVHDGDITHGTHYPEGLMATEVDDQIQIAKHNLLPWFGLPNVRAGRLVHGTSVHTFAGHAENSVARQLAAAFPDVDVHTVGHSFLELAGVRFDIAHHGPSPSIRLWLDGNSLRYYIRDLMLRNLHNGQPTADVVLRAHYHTWLPPETVRLMFRGAMHTSHGVLLPAMSGLTSHARQATKSKPYITVGAVAFEILDGCVVRFLCWVKTLDMRNREVLC